MMKKILSLSLLLGTALAFTACTGEEDDLFDKSAAERLNEVSNIYTQRLIDAKGGWTMEYYPTNSNASPQGLGFLLLTKFNEDRSVTMAMNNEMSDNKFLTENSTWDIITDNGPVLSFNSYNNCLHVFSDPGIYDQGLGLEGDYEFVVIDLQEDAQEATIKGKKRGTYIRLSQLEEGTDFEEYLADVNNFQTTLFPEEAPNAITMTLGEDKYSVINPGTGIIGLYPYGGDEISETTDHPYLISKHGDKYYLRFRDAIEVGAEEDGLSVQEFVYQPEADNFVEVENPEFTIEGSNPVEYFVERLEGGSTWSLSADSEMSDFYADLYSKIDADISSTFSGNLKNIFLRTTNDETKVVLSYGTRNRSYLLNYTFSNYSNSDDTFSIGSVIPENANAEKLWGASASLKTFIELLQQTNEVTAAQTKFNLTTIKFTNKSDASKWLVFSLL